MINFEQNIAQIRDLIGGTLVGEENPGLEAVNYLTWDSRKVHQPEATVFVALSSGERDGHDFVADAFEKGVRQFLVERAEAVPTGGIALVVHNSLEALQDLASLKREGHSAKFFGITGSNGKTIVKEWLKEVLETHFEIGASPGSFNSKLGVALSILQLPDDAEIALIEAGISQPGEMDRLEKMIRPQFGIMTHFGDAHSEGFVDQEEKLAEKLKLFAGAERVFVSHEDQVVIQELEKAGIPFSSIGDLIDSLEKREWGGYKATFSDDQRKYVLEWEMLGDAARDNILLVILVAHHFGLSWKAIRAGINRLYPVSMRMEMLTSNPEVTIINDAYNADRSSVLNALGQLVQSDFQTGHILVLSDLEHLGKLQVSVQNEILEHAVSTLDPEEIYLIGRQFLELAREYKGVTAFLKIEDLIADFDYERFRNRTILLKGARKYELERLIPYLTRRASATHFRINLDRIRHNLAQFRSTLAPGIKIMAMVKAFAYGSGDWEVAQALAEDGIDYLAVAYTSAGIALRTHGVTTPIIVMNADPENINQLFRFNLEPAVYGFPFLQRYLASGLRGGESKIPLHIKVDTGMSRLGFLTHEGNELGALLAKYPQVQLKSVMSHLSMADEVGGDEYTHGQAQKFTSFADDLSKTLSQQPLLHLVNTAGIMRFPEYHFDMVRLGLGLYGTSPVDNTDLDLREVGSLYSVITQVHTFPKGQAIGYGGSSVTKRKSKIATVAIGYADGIRRSLSNGKMSFLVRGQRAPVIGRVCMDMLMLDVTDLEEVTIGDEVVLIGRQGTDFISVQEMAEAAETIAYEILVNIGQRVRRVYVRE